MNEFEMTLSEKLDLLNDDSIRLYKEGVFWVAYEQDAFRLCCVKHLRPSCKYVKVVKQTVISVGFPDSVLQSVLAHFEVKERTAFYVCMSTEEEMKPQAFATWKSEVETTARAVQKVKTELPAMNSKIELSDMPSVYERLRSFRLCTATPMDCMRFVEELQEMIG
jgi:hypothetical protein